MTSPIQHLKMARVMVVEPDARGGRRLSELIHKEDVEVDILRRPRRRSPGCA